MRLLTTAARTTVGCALWWVLGAALADDGAAAPREGAFADIVARTHEAPAEPASLTRSDPVDDPVSRALAGRRGESSDLSYRWWLSRGRADVGFGLGTLTYAWRPVATSALPAGVADAGAGQFPVGSFTTLGMRYRTSTRSSVYADAIHWRGSGLDYGDSVAGKVGVEFKSARSQWNLAYGGLGLRLAGDARMTLKVRRGGLGLYMRSVF